MSRSFIALWAILMLASAIPSSGAGLPAPTKADPTGPVKFVAHRIGNVRSECCCVADFNNDGKLDVAAGPFLYLGPDFKPSKIREIKTNVDEQGKGYMNDFMNAAYDVDGDGNLDIISCDWFQKQVWWYRNPGPGKAGLWVENLLVTNGNYETAMLADVTGEGKGCQILPHIAPTHWYEVIKGAEGKIAAVTHVINERKMDFGIGAGDLNGDGRPDVVRSEAWFEAPADARNGQWKEHPLSLIMPQKSPKIAKHISNVLLHDVNGDGLPDLVYSMAHGYGICWMEQVRQGGEISFKRHMIDESWTQAHWLTLADIDGDGVKELITGKRFMAHNGNDPEETGPLGVFYYKQSGKGENVEWKRYKITFDEGIGAGLNTIAVDLDGDGDLDLVTTGKFGGPVWFENKMK